MNKYEIRNFSYLTALKKLVGIFFNMRKAGNLKVEYLKENCLRNSITAAEINRSCYQNRV